MSEKSSIEDEYPNLNNKFNSDIRSVSEDGNGGYELPLNYYSSEDHYEKGYSLLPIPIFPTDKYKMGRQTDDKEEFNAEFNFVATSDDGTIINDNYSSFPSSCTDV